MNRTVVSGLAAFALLIGAALAMNETAEAGHCGGGLFARLHAKKCGGGLLGGHGCGGGLFSGHHKKCGGGLFARLKARHASNCCAPEPACEPEPTCCEPAPAPCCEPAPAPCCGGEAAPAPCCGGEVAPAPAPCDSCGGGTVMMSTEAGSSQGFDLAPGETLVPGSVSTVAPAAAAEAPASASDAAEEADPPAPEPDAEADK